MTDINKSKMKINILGVDYQIVADDDPERIQSLVSFVDGLIKKTKLSSPSMTNMSAAVLSALNLSDEIFTLRERVDAMLERDKMFDEYKEYKEKYELADEKLGQQDADIRVLQSRNERLELDNQELSELLNEYKEKFSSLRTEYELNKRTLTEMQNKLMENQIELVKVRKTLLDIDEKQI